MKSRYWFKWLRTSSDLQIYMTSKATSLQWGSGRPKARVLVSCSVSSKRWGRYFLLRNTQHTKCPWNRFSTVLQRSHHSLGSTEALSDTPLLGRIPSRIPLLYNSHNMRMLTKAKKVFILKLMRKRKGRNLSKLKSQTLNDPYITINLTSLFPSKKLNIFSMRFTNSSSFNTSSNQYQVKS